MKIDEILGGREFFESVLLTLDDPQDKPQEDTSLEVAITNVHGGDPFEEAPIDPFEESDTDDPFEASSVDGGFEEEDAVHQEELLAMDQQEMQTEPKEGGIFEDDDSPLAQPPVRTIGGIATLINDLLNRA